MNNHKIFTNYQFFIKQSCVQVSFNDESYLKVFRIIQSLPIFGISKLVCVNFIQWFVSRNLSIQKIKLFSLDNLLCDT